MFMQRFITSLILIPLLLGMLFYANLWVLGSLVLLLSLWLAQESWQLIPLHSPLMKALFSLLLLLGVWICFTVFPYWLLMGLLLWAAISFALITYPYSETYWGRAWLVGTLLIALIPLFLQCLIHIYGLREGKSFLVYLFFLVWGADIGAYLVGKSLGHTLFIPKVSPKKSWEGLLGGFALAFLVAFCAFFFFSPTHPVAWFLWAFLTVSASVVGDLFISMLKRRCHLKDTGTIVYGHGGILDRLDSLMAAAPVFYLGLTLFNFRALGPLDL